MSTELTIEATSSAEVSVRGRIDVCNATKALSRGAALFAGKRTTADVSDLQSADSVTLAVLLAWVEHAQNSGGVLRYQGVSERLRSIAQLGDVVPLLGIEAPAAAIAAV